MRKLVLVISSMCSASLAAFAFVGVDWDVHDHELGSGWELFIKYGPTFQLRFENPALSGVEPIPFEQLSMDAKQRLRAYCAVRYGEDDVQRCYGRIQAAHGV